MAIALPRARVRDAADKADACGERARQIGSQPRRPCLKVIRTIAVSNNRVDETVTARKNRIAIMARMSHYDDTAAEQFRTLALLFWRLQSGRSKPLAHAGSGFGLSGLADHLVSYRARWKQFGFSAKAICFLGKSFFKRLGLFESATLHDTTSFLRVLTVGFEFPDSRADSVQV